MSDLPSRVTSVRRAGSSPEVGSISRITVRATVDLPQPLSPTMPEVSPAPIVKVTPSTA